jgi:hypothetical protein
MQRDIGGQRELIGLPLLTLTAAHS